MQNENCEIHFTQKQEAAIAAIVQCPTLSAAAKLAGVSMTSLMRWQRDTNFTDALRAARREIVSQATGLLSQSCTEAVTMLTGIMHNEGYPPAARVTAARTVLVHTFRAIEIDDLNARIQALEDELADREEEKK